MAGYLLSLLSIVSLFFLSLSSCKTVKTTKAPNEANLAAVSGGADGTGGKAAGPAVSGEREVSLDELPRLAVDLDLAGCVGKGRWLDSSTPATPKVGAVSFIPEAQNSSGGEKPPVWIFEPVTDSESGAKPRVADTHVWRLAKGSYTVHAIAYDVATTALESEASKSVDLTASNDVTIKITGTWRDAEKNCLIKWQ